MIKREERIGGQRLILGDCLAIMPLLDKVDAVVACCDAVVYTDKHGKTANWEPETPSASGVNMGEPQGRNSSPVCRGANVSGATGGSLRDEPARDCASVEANGHQVKVAGPGGRAERSIHRRDAKHDLQADGGEGALQQVWGNGSTRCASCGRGSHEQRGRKFGSPVQPLPHQPPQEGMVGFPKGWAILTDPPYGLAQKLQGGTWGKKFAGEDYDWDARPPMMDWIGDTPAIVWGGNYMALPPSRCWLTWYKRDAVRTMADCEHAWTSFDANSRIFDWTIAATNAERVGHPTQKPIALMEWCLGFLPDADTILDPFMGSGTTLVACQKLGRKGIGIECDAEYFGIACKRVEEATRQPDLFVEAATPPEQIGMNLEGSDNG